MVFTKESAFSILELSAGSDQKAILGKYKLLSFRWHPDRHSNSHDSVKHFRQIGQAYRLLAFNNSQEMTAAEARKLFQDTFLPNSCMLNGASDDSTSSDEDTDDSGEDPIEIQFGKYFPGKVKGIRKSENTNLYQKGSLSVEEIEKNCDELITEEEREKRKAQKRRDKKKRRKERKKQEKQEQQKQGKHLKNKANGVQKTNKKMEVNSGSESSSDEHAEFDPTSAFFTIAISKKKKSAGDTKKDRVRNGNHEDEEEIEEVDSTVLRSRKLAIRGNEMAQVGEYNAAIQLFTEAIALDPKDFRFLGNRSYCYDRIQQCEKALKDAEKAIKLAKDWPKGYFRKGRALAGLNRFSEAEEAFLQVLRLDKNCEEAVHELQRVRTHQLTDMGFTQAQALAAIKKHTTVQAALESLLTGTARLALHHCHNQNELNEPLASEVYVSDEEDSAAVRNISTSQVLTPHSADVKMDPKNPEGLTALWVGNVLPQVTERRLTQLFAKYGPVVSVRLLPEKYCAFVNFKLKESAGRAMHALQGYECEGQHLLIRFPDNPINISGNVTIRKNPAAAAPQQTAKPSQAKGVRNIPKQSGPVNGDECYFWRTTGCDYGNACRYRHVPHHKGVDKKPWQK